MKRYLFVVLMVFLLPIGVFAKGNLASDYINSLGDSNLVEDNTNDNNKRYIGSNPNNYVLFNDEVPRITSVRYKIYLNEAIGGSYDDENSCRNDVNNFIGFVLEHGAEYDCRHNETTDKYDLYTTGYFSDEFIDYNGGFDRSDENSCHTFLEGIGADDTYSCVGEDIMFKGWRVIGIFNVNGKNRVKIVRNESIGAYSWDGTPNTVNNGLGRNAWNVSGMMKLLNPSYDSEIANNSLYWNSSSGYCYRTHGASAIPCDFTTNGLNSGRNLIDDALWYTSFVNSVNDPLSLYADERGGNTTIDVPVDSSTTDGVDRESSWAGMVGLPYASDFALASSGCVGNIINNDSSTCATNWLFNNTKPILTMTASREGLARILVNDNANTFTVSDAADAGEIYPTVYLAEDVYITSGSGSITDPFVLAKGKNEANVNITLDGNTYNLADLVTTMGDVNGINWDISDDSVVSLNNGVITPLKAGTVSLDANVGGVYYVINITVNTPAPVVDNTISDNVSGVASQMNYRENKSKLVNPKTTAYAEKLNTVKTDLQTDALTFILFLFVSLFALIATSGCVKKKN